MSMSLNMHAVKSVLVEDLYPQKPGSCITVKMVDDRSQEVCFFLNDNTIKLIPQALHAYAAKRDTPPEPQILPPTYTQTLFAVPEPGVSDLNEVPF